MGYSHDCSVWCCRRSCACATTLKSLSSRARGADCYILCYNDDDFITLVLTYHWAEYSRGDQCYEVCCPMGHSSLDWYVCVYPKTISNSQSSCARRTRIWTQSAWLENVRGKQKRDTIRFTLHLHHLRRIQNQSPIFEKMWRCPYDHVLGDRWIADIYWSIYFKCHGCTEGSWWNKTVIRQGRSVRPTGDDVSKTRPLEFRSTKSREYWHADTVPLGKMWNHVKHALVMVDGFTRMLFVYLIKDKSHYTVAAALEEHFLQQRPTSKEIKGINFFINRTILRSDRGNEFINSSIHDLCERISCNDEYSCPGQSGKYQNGLVEWRIKKIGELHDAVKKCLVFLI